MASRYTYLETETRFISAKLPQARQLKRPGQPGCKMKSKAGFTAGCEADDIGRKHANNKRTSENYSLWKTLIWQGHLLLKMFLWTQDLPPPPFRKPSIGMVGQHRVEIVTKCSFLRNGSFHYTVCVGAFVYFAFWTWRTSAFFRFLCGGYWLPQLFSSSRFRRPRG